MRQVSVLVEGQTEETFVKEILAEHLYGFGISLVPTIVKTKKLKRGPHYKGGVVNYGHIKRDLVALLHNSNAHRVTTMLDLYALPNNFPLLQANSNQGVEKALDLEMSLFEDIGNDRFLPYIQVHEFEALLFSDASKFSYAFSDNQTRQLVEVATQFDSPEEINDTPQGAPSKRILNVVGENRYQKTLHGPIIALEISLAVIRDKCPHFNEWINKLENL